MRRPNFGYEVGFPPGKLESHLNLTADRNKVRAERCNDLAEKNVGKIIPLSHTPLTFISVHFLHKMHMMHNIHCLRKLLIIKALMRFIAEGRGTFSKP
jgi:hypothetical protein